MSTTALIGGVLEVLAFGAAAYSMWITVVAFPHLPATVPIHFGLRGQPNQWGPRGFVFLLPAIAVAEFVAVTLTNPIFGFVLVDKTGAVLHPLIPMPCGVFAATLVLFAAIQRGMLESARTGTCLNMRIVLPAVAFVIVFIIAAAATTAIPSGR